MTLILAKTHLLKLNFFIRPTIIFSCILFSACSTPSLVNNSNSYDFYLLNAQTGAYCKGYNDAKIASSCLSIIPTNFYLHEVKVIENIYQQQIREPNRLASLMNILISGKNLDYQATPLGNARYQLPINQQTDTVWDVLEKVDELNYRNK
jgi:hypothetical protein